MPIDPRTLVTFEIYRLGAVGDTLLHRTMTIDQARAYVDNWKSTDRRQHLTRTYAIETRETRTIAQEKIR